MAASLWEKVDGADRFAGLPDAVGPAVALVEFHRIPGDVVMNHYAGTLQVESFRSEVGGDEAIDRAAAEGLDRGTAVARRGKPAAQAPR